MKQFSINVVHTVWGEHHLLTKDNVLLKQLEILSCNPNICINILLNGKDACDGWRNEWLRNNHSVKFLEASDPKVRIYKNEKNPFTHGASIQYLHNLCNTRYYICIDEDDEFTEDFMESPTSLFKQLPEGKLVTYRFYWVKKDYSVAYPCFYENRYDMKSIRSFSNWNFIFDKKFLDDHKIVRPDVNKYDDCLYYERLWSAYKGLCYLREMRVLNYRNDHSVLSKGEDDIQPYINYMLKDKVFSIIDVIK